MLKYTFVCFFWCHLGHSVEKTGMILPHLYIIGLKIVLRDIRALRVDCLKGTTFDL